MSAPALLPFFEALLPEALVWLEDLVRLESHSRSQEGVERLAADLARRIIDDDYPHQFSGGMRQRVMIAMGLSCNPQLLIADEPTTALDVTIQAQITDLVKKLKDEIGMAVIWITHDLGIIAGLANRVNVMYAGHVVETADVKDIYGDPRHPYTLGLLRLDSALGCSAQEKLIPIDGRPPDLIGRHPRLPVCRSLCFCH